MSAPLRLLASLAVPAAAAILLALPASADALSARVLPAGPLPTEAFTTSVVYLHFETLDIEIVPAVASGHRIGGHIKSLRLLPVLNAHVVIRCSDCSRGSPLAHGISDAHKARGKFVGNDATITITVTAKGKGGRFIRRLHAGSPKAESEYLCLVPGKKIHPFHCEEPPPPPVAPALTVPPQVSGNHLVGQQLACLTGPWTGNPAPKVSYTWLEDGSKPVESPNAPYVIPTEDEGHTLSCNVTASNAAGSKSVSSDTVTVEAPPTTLSSPEVTGPREAGDTLQCALGTWKGYPTPTFTYTWIRNDSPLPSGANEPYVVGSEEEGSAVACEVKATNQVNYALQASSPVRIVAPPKNVTAPQVTGTREAGDTLHCALGTWKGYPSPAFTYTWFRNGSEVTSGANEPYVVGSNEEGDTVACAVKAANEVSAAITPSEFVRLVAPPRNVGAPEVTGDPEPGETVHCIVPSWKGYPTPSEAFQWLRGGVAIEGQTHTTYVVLSSDEGRTLACEVTETNASGKAEGVSAPVTVVAPPVNVLPPAVSGTPQAGDTLRCSLGTWKGYPVPTETEQWLRDGAPISGAEGTTYIVPSDDEGESLICEVTATNSVNHMSIKSQPVSVEAAPRNVVPPAVSGTPQSGETLRCSLGTWKGYPVPTETEQWLRNGVPISGAETTTYIVPSSDEGQALACEVTATNSVNEASIKSQPVTILQKPKNTVAPQISGTAKVGGALACSEGSWEAVPPPTFTYRWLREDKAITGAGEEDYEVHAEDEGHSLTCQVTATNTLDFQSATSKGVAVPEEAKKRQEEEAAEKKLKEEEAKAREAREQKEKEDNTITSVDNTKGDLAPFAGIFEIAYQPFTANSDVITYAGVTIGNAELPTGRTTDEVTLKLCKTPECGGTGSERGHTQAIVNNYELSAAEFEGGVSVTPGDTYYLVWTPPPLVKGLEWVAFWHAGGPYVRVSQEMEAIVRGYDGQEEEGKREKISYPGTEPPPAPHVGPFEYAFQNFKAASNRITKLGVVVGNPKLARGAEQGETIDLRLCENSKCEGGEQWAPVTQPIIVNYGITEATIDAEVVPDHTYYVYWSQPAAVEGEPWVTFWYGNSGLLKEASGTQAFAKGFDAESLTYTPPYFAEQPENGAISTFTDYKNASGEGPEINASQTVEVSCKIFAPEIQSVEPEGFWYRIHTAPWSDKYYAAANAFLNGGRPGEAVYTDPNVPNC